MRHDTASRTARRKVLKWAASSPLALTGAFGLSGKQTPAGPPVITKAEDALDIFDFEAAARGILPPAHFGYLATGTDGEDTIRANRDAFGRYQLRVRRLVNVAKPDLSLKLFGASYDSPIVLAPVGSQRLRTVARPSAIPSCAAAS